MKKIFALLIASILVLTGCSSMGGSDVLTVWAYGSEAEEIATMAPDFTAETGIEVEVVPIPWDTAHDKALTAVASQEGPDVIQMPTAWTPEFTEVGALADMTPYVEQYPETFSETSYLPASVEYMYDENGTQVSVPYYADTYVLYTRDDILAEAGVTVPTTWDELYDTCKTLVDGGTSELCINLENNQKWMWFSYLAAYGWTFWENDEVGNFNFDDELVAQWLEVSKKFYDEGLAKLDDDVDLLESFTTGRIPIVIGGPWLADTLYEDYPEMAEQWSVSLMPMGSAANGSFYGGSGWSIFEWSDQKDEAAAFIDWMCQPEQQVAMYEAAAILPTNLAAWEDPVLAEDENAMIMYDQLNKSMVPPFFADWTVVTSHITTEQNAFYYGDQDIATTQENMQALAEQEYNK